MFKRKKLPDLLVEKGLVSKKEIEIATIESKKKNTPLPDALVDLGYIKESDLLPVMAESMKVPYVSLAGLEIPPEALAKVPQSLAKKHYILPTNFEDNVLTLAMANPTDIFIVDEISFQNNCEVQRVIALKDQITEAIRRSYVAGSMDALLSELQEGGDMSEAQRKKEMEALEEMGDDSPVIKLVNLIFEEAVRRGASDIHVEPDEGVLRTRYRVDGVLRAGQTLQAEVHASVISRIKILSGMDISEKRIPQDGRIQRTVLDRPLDFRVSTVPTVWGEKVCLRILDKTNVQVDLKEMGMGMDLQRDVEKLISSPNGMFLVTGPTGSGKTTTLYACVNFIRCPELNICTVENPVEYRLTLINQVQVHHDVGLDFASSLRAFLRQDPDVIMVGEIRDQETAQIGVEAALTGHLVFSTLHTNDAPSAAPRLIDMGVEPFLVSSAFLGILAQRLTRKICPNCKIEDDAVTPEMIQDFGLPENFIKRTYYKGEGCDKCMDSGYKGRLGIFELLAVNDEIRRLILLKASGTELLAAAVKYGMKTLRQDAIIKWVKGSTTAAEINRLTKE
ncbi:GspE/PulE family protein [Candidatus Riflebacteria bacterium]